MDRQYNQFSWVPEMMNRFYKTHKSLCKAERGLEQIKTMTSDIKIINHINKVLQQIDKIEMSKV